jgi:LPS export ABC transporter protein LptC
MVSPRNIRLALAIIVMTATIGIVAAILQKGSKSISPEPISQHIPQNIDLALQNARFTEMRDGTVVWVLVADKAEYDKSGETALLTGIKMGFSKTKTSGAVTVTAAKGNYSANSRNVRLRGKVRMVTEEGAVFETESIDYISSRSSFITAQPVKFKHQRLELTARGMEMDVNSQQANFHKPVDALVEGHQVR